MKIDQYERKCICKKNTKKNLIRLYKSTADVPPLNLDIYVCERSLNLKKNQQQKTIAAAKTILKKTLIWRLGPPTTESASGTVIRGWWFV